MNDDPVQSLWDEHVTWSATAGRLKSERGAWRSRVTGLTIAGAALQTAAATIPAVKFFAGAAGVVVLALVPLLSKYFLTSDATSNWLRARSISEGIKSEFYLYRAGAEPYNQPDSQNLLRRKVRAIASWAEKLQLELVKTGRKTSPAPPALDAEAYIDRRVQSQIDGYYRPNAQKNLHRAEQFRWIEIATAILAATLGALATFYGGAEGASISPWVAVITTIGGGLASHAAAQRYEFQATTFFATARQLEDLVVDWRASGGVQGSKSWSDFVQACENVISAENRAWMAKLDEKP